MSDKREPCEYHLEFANSVSTIKETLLNMDKMLTNHWNEIKTAIEKYYALDKKVSEHTLLLKAISEERLNTTKASQYRIALICSIVCSIPSFIMTAIVLIKFFGGK